MGNPVRQLASDKAGPKWFLRLPSHMQKGVAHRLAEPRERVSREEQVRDWRAQKDRAKKG